MVTSFTFTCAACASVDGRTTLPEKFVLLTVDAKVADKKRAEGGKTASLSMKRVPARFRRSFASRTTACAGIGEGPREWVVACSDAVVQGVRRALLAFQPDSR